MKLILERNNSTKDIIASYEQRMEYIRDILDKVSYPVLIDCTYEHPVERFKGMVNHKRNIILSHLDHIKNTNNDLAITIGYIFEYITIDNTRLEKISKDSNGKSFYMGDILPEIFYSCSIEVKERVDNENYVWTLEYEKEDRKNLVKILGENIINYFYKTCFMDFKRAILWSYEGSCIYPEIERALERAA